MAKELKLPPAQLIELANHFIKQALSSGEEGRTHGVEQQEVLSLEYVSRLEDNELDLHTGYLKRIAPKVREVLDVMRPGDALQREQFDQLCRLFLIAEQRIYREELQRNAGDYRRRRVLLDESLIPADSAEEHADAASRKLSEAADEYIKFKESDWSRTSKSTFQKALARFQEFCGNRPMRTYTRQECRRFHDALRQWPVENERRKLQGDIHSILASAWSGKSLAVPSINKDRSVLSAFFGWAVEREEAHKNPFDGIKRLKDTRRQSTLRERFTHADLKSVFGDGYPGPEDEPEKFWIPLILLHSGARLNEIAQLRAVDVEQFDGVWCFDIGENAEGQSVKNAASIRKTPVHQFLIDHGFIEYVIDRRQSSSGRLWENLERTRTRSQGASVSKWFNGRLSKLGLKERGQLDCHSFRHTFTDELRQNREEESVADEITGHAKQGMSYGRYAKQMSLQRLKEAVDRVRYELPPLKRAD